MIRDWLEHIAARWAGGRFDECQFGHGDHSTLDVNLRDGAPFRVFDAPRYETERAGYCDGRDEVSRAILANRWWEDAGTALIAQHCSGGAVIDIGSHVGWYTVQAAKRGCWVLAVDASVEHLRVLEHNTMDYSDQVVLCRGWIGDATPPIGVPRGTSSVKLVKIDIEGGEADAVAALWPLFASKFIEYALIEVSPVFTGADKAEDTVRRLLSLRYRAYIVPNRAEQTRNMHEVTEGNVRQTMKERPQMDLWWVRC